MKTKLEDYTIAKSARIIDALTKINDNKMGFVIVLDDGDFIAGTLTDGDIRRALLAGKELRDPIVGAFSEEYRSVSMRGSMFHVVECFKDPAIDFLPITTVEGKLFNIVTKKQLHSLMLMDKHIDLAFDFMGVDENLIDYEIFQRPWGFYKTTVMNDYFQSKVISVFPGASISLQSHNRREEHWIVAHGIGEVQIGESKRTVGCGTSLFIPKGCKHCLANTGQVDNLIVVEVQIGSYFGEDDIIRYADRYGRHTVAETTEPKPPIPNVNPKPAAELNIPEIKMFLTDCDGCLTDGGMYYSEHGDELKKFNTRDGMGFQLLKQQGIITGIITAESVQLNRRRASKLALDIFEEGVTDKAAMLKKLSNQYEIALENIAYVGDDINDLEAIRMVGLGCCPADAVPSVKEAAKVIATTKGGGGVIREVIQMISDISHHRVF